MILRVRVEFPEGDSFFLVGFPRTCERANGWRYHLKHCALQAENTRSLDYVRLRLTPLGMTWIE